MSADELGRKGDRTRMRIRTAALRSFREHGYDATTIRRIADELGLSVGATNYHFPSKNHLIQELYRDVQEAHRAAAEPALAVETNLIERLRIVYSVGLDQLEPYHPHAGEFLSAAVSPRSPINPLSEQSAESLTIVQNLFIEAIDGAAATGLPNDVRTLLPRALVLAHLLLAMFWVYDSSDDRIRTRRLLDRGLGLLKTALPMARLPILRGLVKDLLSLVGEVRA
ncbi:TetR/AcrR family transcriptional regulator [Microbacterium rhizomatis]|uniref:TetR/AcrR family transcriptional regulator n=1 Tax=Microbacterium rhizomatis TaxID=1631477 RepID=A0A5J5J5J2_9MICO|nr:TetR/AcrR family transcriptional regulator [Microbacterium rhizomatis]KAA9110404.1 TetR/AcrR family transcriptional regulator [Microbacterium rhizomatis]